MSRVLLTIELPENLIATLRKIGEARNWGVGCLIEDAIMTMYSQEIVDDAMEKYLGADDDSDNI